MAAPKRVFHAEPAVRKAVPLLVGIMSPSGGGKTLSALRLATGIQRVMGGQIFGVDTENNRMRHYADDFKFQHVPFGAPFGSLDYLDCLRQCHSKGARITIVDSMTHEHIGEGGYLETAESTVTRIAGANASFKDRQKVQMLGWATAGPLRQKMIEGIKQLDGAFIFCFRAKEKTKPVRKQNGETEIIDMGFMPIAGEEWVYEMTLNCMLEPRSDGVPTWRTDHIGERMMMKLPIQFKSILAESAPLSEDIGERLAHWAAGGSGNVTHSRTAVESGTHAASSPNPPAGESSSVPLAPSKEASAPAGPEIDESERLVRVGHELREASELGYKPLAARWKLLSNEDTITFLGMRDRILVPRALEVDRAKQPPTPGAPVQRADLLL
jgi:hypothetical protein